LPCRAWTKKQEAWFWWYVGLKKDRDIDPKDREAIMMFAAQAHSDVFFKRYQNQIDGLRSSPSPTVSA
jgi:hypothetical protein